MWYQKVIINAKNLKLGNRWRTPLHMSFEELDGRFERLYISKNVMGWHFPLDVHLFVDALVTLITWSAHHVFTDRDVQICHLAFHNTKRLFRSYTTTQSVPFNKISEIDKLLPFPLRRLLPYIKEFVFDLLIFNFLHL